MFLGKNTKNLRSLFTVFAIAMTVVLSGASMADAQVVRNTLHNFVDVTGFPNRTDFTTLRFGAAATDPIRWKTTGNPANPAPNQAFRREFDFGLTGSNTAITDNVVAADYTGDNRTEVAVWRDATASGPGTFYVSQFPIGTGGITLERAVQFGNGFTDTAGVQGDYDGDGKDDYTVVRNSGGTLFWYILSSGTNSVKVIPHGSTIGIPAQQGAAVFPGADFTGDGRDELVYLTRNAAGTVVNYFIGDANTGAGVITRSFGNFNTDFSVAPDDYTGDGRADFVAVRQNTGTVAVWYIANSQNTTVTGRAFGLADPTFMGKGDTPVRGDFDGDRIHDLCVYRDSNATFYYISSAANAANAQQHGAPGDFPIGSFALY